MLRHDVLSFFILAFKSRILNLVPPSKALSGTPFAATGTSIFAQYPNPRNRQIGWASRLTSIVALENLWNQMQVNHDADAMGSMLENDFVLTDYDGSVYGKGQFLATIRDKTTQLTVEVSENMKLYHHGDTVIVTGSTSEKGKQEGKPFPNGGRFTDTWIKKDSQWMCIASQLSLIGK
jgi:ketosteroid isomerase-like protein